MTLLNDGQTNNGLDRGRDGDINRGRPWSGLRAQIHTMVIFKDRFRQKLDMIGP